MILVKFDERAEGSIEGRGRTDLGWKMPGMRRQADGRTQGRSFPERDVRVRVQEVQRPAKTDAAGEDLRWM